MINEEILKEIALLKAQQKKCKGTFCSIYGTPQTDGADPARVNGCCNPAVTKKEK
jgi:hypothetical protein